MCVILYMTSDVCCPVVSALAQAQNLLYELNKDLEAIRELPLDADNVSLITPPTTLYPTHLNHVSTLPKQSVIDYFQMKVLLQPYHVVHRKALSYVLLIRSKIVFFNPPSLNTLLRLSFSRWEIWIFLNAFKITALIIIRALITLKQIISVVKHILSIHF